jgi:hypothetical protein
MTRTRRLLKYSIIAGSATLFVLLPIVWFWQKSDNATLSVSSGFHLFNRMVIEQKELNQDGPATKRLLSLMAGADPRTFQSHSDVRNYGSVRDLGYDEAERLPSDVSKEALFGNPWRYITYTLRLGWRDFLVPTDWFPPWSDTDPQVPSLENSPLVAFASPALGWRRALDSVNRTVWPISCWLAILGTLLGLMTRYRFLTLVMAVVLVGYLLSSAVVEFFSPRYNGAMVPFVGFLAVLPVQFLFRKHPIEHAHTEDS